jgi:predicted phosphohydrolase
MLPVLEKMIAAKKAEECKEKEQLKCSQQLEREQLEWLEQHEERKWASVQKKAEKLEERKQAIARRKAERLEKSETRSAGSKKRDGQRDGAILADEPPSSAISNSNDSEPNNS